MPLAETQMDLEIVILSEVSQAHKKNNIIYHLYVESKEMVPMNLFTKQKLRQRCRKETCGYQRGKGKRNKLGDQD